MAEDPVAWTPGIANLPWDETSDDESSVSSQQGFVESLQVGKADTGDGVEAVLPAPEPQENVQEHIEEESVPRGRRRYCTLGILTALLVVVAASVVAVLFAGNKNDTPIEGEPQTSGVGHPASSREQAFQEILKEISGDALLEQDSPQERAFQWLVWLDPAKLEPQADERQIQERYILAVFYFATKGAEWLDSFGFLSEKNVCNWKDQGFGMGVTCDENLKTVQAIQIGPNNLQGTLPDEIFLLQGLTSFQIFMNPGLTGPIPSTVGTLRYLQVLNLNKNSLSGVVPDSLLKLPSLTTLWMDGNSFEGSYPPIGDDSTLQWWSCNACGLQGEIPETLQYPSEDTLLSHRSS